MSDSFEKSNSNIPNLKIADPRYAFRGLTYGDWVAVWWNHFFSAQPDNYYDPGRGIVFLRGSVEYTYEDEPAKRVYTGQTKELGLRISKGTALFFPVITSLFVIDDKYQGVMMNNQLSIRSAARLDTLTGGTLWARIMSEDGKIYPLVEKLDHFLVESPLFTLLVDESNPFKTKMDGPIEAGLHHGVSVGVYILISDLSEGKKYRLEFGGKGVGRYFTNSIYDIEVSREPEPLLDISSKAESSRMAPIGSPLAAKPIHGLREDS
ncbi:MAG: hypothetical protein ACR2F1_03335 [Nitrososphaeraceae archaeon]